MTQNPASDRKPSAAITSHFAPSDPALRAWAIVLVDGPHILSLSGTLRGDAKDAEKVAMRIAACSVNEQTLAQALKQTTGPDQARAARLASRVAWDLLREVCSFEGHSADRWKGTLVYVHDQQGYPKTREGRGMREPGNMRAARNNEHRPARESAAAPDREERYREEARQTPHPAQTRETVPESSGNTEASPVEIITGTTMDIRMPSGKTLQVAYRPTWKSTLMLLKRQLAALSEIDDATYDHIIEQAQEAFARRDAPPPMRRRA